MSDREIHTQPDEMTAFRAGDEDAVSGAFDRFGDGIYSYFLARTGDEEIAADATHRTFARAASPESDPAGEIELKTWLFANARSEARDGDLGFALSDPEGEPDLRLMALSAMSGLGTRDRDLTMLRAAGDLDDDELIAVAGLDPTHGDDTLSKTRRRVEGALGPLLVARFGTSECHDLGRLVGHWDGSFDSRTRASVNRHVSDCPTCARNRSQLVGAAGVLSQLLTVPAGPELRNQVIDDLTVVPEPEPIESTPGPAVEPEPDASPPTMPPSPPQRGPNDLVMLGVFVVLAIVLGLIGLAVVERFEPLDIPASTIPGDERGQPSSTPSTTPDRTTTTTFAVTTAPSQDAGGSPPSFVVAADTVDFGSDITVGQLEITNTGDRAGEVTIESSSEALVLAAGVVEIPAGQTTAFDVGLDREAVEEGDIQETITLTWEGGQLEVPVSGSQIDNPIIHNPRAAPPSLVVDGGAGCTNTQTTVSARITDTSSFEAVVRWGPSGGASETTTMTDVGGDVFEAVVGPFSSPGAAEVRIVATDELGNAGGASISIPVDACP